MKRKRARRRRPALPSEPFIGFRTKTSPRRAHPRQNVNACQVGGVIRQDNGY